MSTAITPPNDNQDDRTVGQDADHDSSAFDGRSTTPPSSREVVRHQKERFGGMKFGACFFGWLTATGTAVLLTALLAAAGTAFGLSQNVTAGQAQSNASTIGIAGGIALLVVVLLAYFCGGYVAGRMARFNGVRQGVGVFLWAIIAAVVVAVLTAIAGSKFNILSNLNGFPRIPINEGSLTTGGIITAIIVVAAALVGAILGGLAGMRYHRKIDYADLDADH